MRVSAVAIAALCGFGACLPSFEGKTCRSASECASGEICDRGLCAAGVEDAGDSGDAGDAGDGGGDAGRGDADASVGPQRPAIAGLARGLSEHHSCAWLVNGVAYCWGRNADGQLGREGTELLRPSQVAGITRADEMAIGSDHTCVRTGGEVRCFGKNDHAQLGGGSQAPSESTPVLVPMIDDAQSIAAGYAFTCAVRANGEVWCWGATHIQDDPGDPPHVVGRGVLPAAATRVVAGAEHAAAILENGELWGWGHPGCDRLGLGENLEHATPVPMSAFPPGRVIDAALGDIHGCALLESHELYCWGCSGAGQVGTATVTKDPFAIDPPVRILGGVRAVRAGFRNTCAVLDDNSVRCWGSNDYGGVGDGALIPALPVAVPTPVLGIGAVENIELYWQHACAVLSDDRGVACWGYGSDGEIGDGAKMSTPFPAIVL